MAELESLGISAALGGILFAEDFGDDESSPDAPCRDDGDTDEIQPKHDIAEVEPHFSAGEVAAARQEGFDAGRAAGRDDTAAQQHRRVGDAIEKIGLVLDRDSAASLELTERSVEAVAHLLVSMLAAMLPSVCNRHAAREIAETVRNLVGGISHDTVMSISVAASLQDPVRSALMSLPVHIARRVVVIAVDTIPDGDASIEWTQGRASHSTKRTREAAIEILTQLGLLAPAQPQRSNAEKQSADLTPAHSAKIEETIDA